MSHVIHNHRGAETIVCPMALSSLCAAIERSRDRLINEGTQRFRDRLMHQLASDGWSGPVRVKVTSNMTVTSIRRQTALCVQTGNTSRVYADLLKLETLFRNSVATCALYVIPCRHLAKEIGSNIATFERLVDELKIFDVTLTVPIVVVGMR